MLNNTNSPLITVVIPSYNRIKFLEQALQSVFSQTLEDYEVVVINDGSSDSGYFNHDYIDKIHQINLETNQKNLHGFGPGAIRNFGNIKSNTKYIAFLDDDDVWMPQKLEKQIEILENSEQKMICSDAYIGNGLFDINQNYESFLNDFYFDKHKKIYFRNKFISYFRNFSYPEVWNLGFLNSFMNLANPIITSSVIIEREILDKIGWFRNLPFAADYDCWRGIMQFTDCYFVNEKLIYYDNSHGDGRNYFK